jgi:hypothetical protein
MMVEQDDPLQPNSQQEKQGRVVVIDTCTGSQHISAMLSHLRASLAAGDVVIIPHLEMSPIDVDRLARACEDRGKIKIADEVSVPQMPDIDRLARRKIQKHNVRFHEAHNSHPRAFRR